MKQQNRTWIILFYSKYNMSVFPGLCRYTGHLKGINIESPPLFYLTINLVTLPVLF